MARLNLRNLRKSFGAVDIIKGVDLDVEHGEFVVFVGPSGCGKSTLLRIISGLENATAGEILIDGETVNDHTPFERGIAMVFQSYALYPHMTVAENMGFPLKMVNQPADAIREKVTHAASLLQLEPLLERKPSQLSGGQKQRVAMGRTIVRDPKIFLFDEPLSNLDAELRIEMRVGIEKLHRELGATMIYVTHDQVEAMTLADRIVVLRDGRIEQVGAPLDLYDRPDNLFVASFLGSPKLNVLAITAKETGNGLRAMLADGTELDLALDFPGVVPGSALQLGIRPEALGVSSGNISLPFTMDIHERLGPTSYLYGTCAGDRLVGEHRERGRVRQGEISRLCFNAAECHVFDATGRAIAHGGKVAA